MVNPGKNYGVITCQKKRVSFNEDGNHGPVRLNDPSLN
jgi:hypothetical protein